MWCDTVERVDPQVWLIRAVQIYEAFAICHFGCGPGWDGDGVLPPGVGGGVRTPTPLTRGGGEYLPKLILAYMVSKYTAQVSKHHKK